MKAAVIACDLCELRTDVVWVFRSDHFTVLIGDEPHYYRDDEEWGVCVACKRDVLADQQEPILARRRAALVRDSQPGWDGLSTDDQAFVFQTLDLVVLTFLACRQKRYGRAWTTDDTRLAIGQLREDGGRGLRH